jgi:hypothetical protein
MASYPLLAERSVAEGVAERGAALVDDLLAVRNEQEAAPREFLGIAQIVEIGVKHSFRNLREKLLEPRRQ